ncbi:protein sax-3-like [Bemisia tabaci]|uniref:protein sax-3-like n=1 Tax=Bemisia tabaci TaxID=7038 RepID=UPI003B285C8C
MRLLIITVCLCVIKGSSAQAPPLHEGATIFHHEMRSSSYSHFFTTTLQRISNSVFSRSISTSRCLKVAGGSLRSCKSPISRYHAPVQIIFWTDDSDAPASNIDEDGEPTDYDDYEQAVNETEGVDQGVLSGNKTSVLKFHRSLSNLTREAGSNVKLRCEVGGEPAPNKHQWFKNEVPIEEQRGRITVKRYPPKRVDFGASVLGTKLVINHLDPHDRGYYKCQVSNGISTIESTAVLMVKAPPSSKNP